ncbi:HPr family phosphocarrier protein [Schumannella luteola]|uniref:HPr family phosphocarrier protein n=2 Tax=Protaetiibacter mangrovi TaxID=2970926 RepID=A0ABT1ZD95_9MICO|nr:HPr family phosphocarrier protein [Protaetiibacter mangrovi]MCS0498667.1 HPr family phosphocarrier protein [Protaetiibacter mangrovi]TPX00478.1 HPr family phosphocarrier protein [Schumannella luteola]
MMERTVTIASGHGLHARPAKLFTQAVAASGHKVTIGRPGGSPVNAASILGIIAAGFENGDEVVLDVEGDESERVLGELSEFLTTDHDEAAG